MSPRAKRILAFAVVMGYGLSATMIALATRGTP